MKICKSCKEEKPDDKFQKRNLSCNACIYKKVKEREEKEKAQMDPNEERECSICNDKKKLDRFNGKRKQCKDCLNKRKREKSKLKSKSNDERKGEIKCIECEIKKPVSSYYKGRNKCKDCSNKARREKTKKLQENINLIENKTCNKCKIEKKIENFYVGENKCKKCRIEEKKLRLLKHKEKEKEYTHKECITCKKEYGISFFRTGENVCNSCQKEKLYKWRKDNPEKMEKINKKYREKEDYREKQNAIKKQIYNNNINERLTRKYRQKLRNYIFKNSSKEQRLKYEEIFGCSKHYIKMWIESNMTKEMTWDNYGTYWNLDHVKPCASFNLEEKDNLLECFNWRNTMPVTVKQNLKKNTLIDNLKIIKYEIWADKFKEQYEYKYGNIYEKNKKVLRKKSL